MGILGVNVTIEPLTWPLWLKVVLSILAGGVGAFLAAQFLVTFRKALVVGVASLVCGGVAAVFLWQPTLPGMKEGDKAPAKSVSPAPGASQQSAPTATQRVPSASAVPTAQPKSLVSSKKPAPKDEPKVKAKQDAPPAEKDKEKR